MRVITSGYPAYAGIDLTCPPCSSAFFRLPRIRGDRPETIYDALQDLEATPHTRGSTFMT